MCSRDTRSLRSTRASKIPAQFEVALFPGEETLGGEVVDEQGRPIAGVKVEIWGYLGEKKLKNESAIHVNSTTDAQGNWRCRCFRSMTFAYLYLSHPDYLSDNGLHPRRHGRPTQSDVAQPDEKPLAGLRDFSDVQVMARGVELSGKVVDQRATPVPGAEVGWMPEDERNTFHDSLATTHADAAGRFRFPNVRPGKVMLQVKAKGHAPALKAVEPGNAVIVKLEAPHTLRGRVVDSHGKPIPKAFIGIDSWRNYRSLGVFFTTGRDGRFQWDDAPADPVLVNASHIWFKSVYMQSASHDEEAVFTLTRSLSISGRILDASTKKGIDKVRVLMGIPEPKTGAVRWFGNAEIFALQGHIQAEVDIERTPEFRLRFEAKGYEPVESRLFRGGEAAVEYYVNMVATGKQ